MSATKPNHLDTTYLDAHCHIDLLRDPAGAIAEAEQANTHTVAVTNAPSVFFHTRDLCRGKRFVHPAVGLHPELVGSHGHELPRLIEEVATTPFVGEVGLDYVTSDMALRKRQREVFSSVVQATEDRGGKIISIHSRRAAGDVIASFCAQMKSTAILHWFSGTRKELDQAIAKGFFFSVNAAMLSSKSGLTIVEAIPRDRMLTETDAPFAKVDNRPSSPRDAARAIDLLASTWSVSRSECVKMVISNFERLLAKHNVKA